MLPSDMFDPSGGDLMATWCWVLTVSIRNLKIKLWAVYDMILGFDHDY